MAHAQEMDYTYTLFDKIFRWNVGEAGDFSCARYQGDFSLSLEEAQRQKHDFIYDNLRITEQSRVLDMGCGWGPFLAYLRGRGVQGIGVTLSSGQANACRKSGLDVHVMDCRTLTRDAFGGFDAVVSLGAFEHFCSVEDFYEKQQDTIYQNFFSCVHQLLPPGGRFYLQTMVFGKNRIDYDKFDFGANKHSNEYLLAAMERQFPGSWLPFGQEQIAKNASAYFKLASSSSGRLDYVETIRQWGKRYDQRSLRKALKHFTLLPSYLTSRQLRQRLDKDFVRANILCFERELMDHYRIVFEKI